MRVRLFANNRELSHITYGTFVKETGLIKAMETDEKPHVWLVSAQAL